MPTKDLLRDEITRIIGEMRELEVGSDEYKAKEECLTKLVDRFNEMDKADSQWSAAVMEDERQKSEIQLKEKQFELEKKVHEDDEVYKAKQIVEERRKTIVNIALTVLGIVTTTTVTVWGTVKSLKFEERGTITTIAGRSFITKLFSKK